MEVSCPFTEWSFAEYGSGITSGCSAMTIPILPTIYASVECGLRPALAIEQSGAIRSWAISQG